MVIYGATIGGHVYSARTTFNVLRPEADLASTITTDTPAIDVDQDVRVRGGEWVLHFGIPESGTTLPGITWHATVTVDAGEAGQIAFVQLVKPDDHIVTAGDSRTKKQSYDFVLDCGPFPVPQYAGHLFPVHEFFTYADISEDDSPNSGLGDFLKHNSRNDTFETYLMYKPDTFGSIWVTLCKLDWFWKGAATKDANGGWSLDPGSADYPHTNPAGVDSTDLPQWETNFPALPITPEN